MNGTPGTSVLVPMPELGNSHPEEIGASRYEPPHRDLLSVAAFPIITGHRHTGRSRSSRRPAWSTISKMHALQLQRIGLLPRSVLDTSADDVTGSLI
jgi:hypothetical protein